MTPPIHPIVAGKFLEKLEAAWASEEDMTAVFERLGRGPKFDRTEHARPLVERLFNDAWAETWNYAAVAATDYDKEQVFRILCTLTSDYNLLSQVGPNLLTLMVRVDGTPLTQAVAAASTAYLDIRKNYDDLHNPFEGGRAKRKVSEEHYPSEVVAVYKTASAVAKVKSILESPRSLAYNSYRITPFGSTPALTDEANLTALPAQGDAMLKPIPVDYVVTYLTTDEPAPMEQSPDMAYVVSDLPEGQNTFRSRSGGDILTSALAARRLAGSVWKLWAAEPALRGVCVVPRLNSVLVVAPTSFDLSRLNNVVLTTAREVSA